ncbi:PAS domain S-box protein [Alkalilimnicola ehrlichii MLHE-1]|uniref:Diguanylate cyclase with PAS/PAC sensor n=1 Tax=Alkalilimnicola ehrlichii (strain ATCC BAA-1101 / DSM 17681 / MLHE-1) TaxID=187272 RepID=Q0A5N6_ALKEH|nr:PAS domain S-box protein [Alkalilimnicola ehrlichii]ABI57851.1 diguanylate cyclase with PAS/PAC sensor [Alkalilimnicola ehrlichii MLHE-1]
MEQGLDESLLRAAVEQSYNAVVVTDPGLEGAGQRIRYVNAAFERMTGYTREELIGHTPKILQGAATDPAVLRTLRQRLAAGQGFEGSAINYRKDGRPYHVEWLISPVRDDSGRITAWLSIQRDVTHERELEQEARLLSTAVESSAASILITDTEGCIVYVNRGFEQITGYRRDEVLGETPAVLNSGEQSARFYRDLWTTLERGETFRGTFLNRNRSGALFYLEQSITPVRADQGQVVRYVATGKDITERVRMEEELKRAATTDALTGLANRLSFEQLLERDYERCRRYGGALSLLMFDLDHFKAVNDAHGHEAGDAVLQALAGLVLANVRTADTVARWGGEEFMVLLPETPLAAAGELAEKLRERVAAHRFPHGAPVTASFGVCALRDDDTCRTLVRRADEALYRAKHLGRDRVECLSR